MALKDYIIYAVFVSAWVPAVLAAWAVDAKLLLFLNQPIPVHPFLVLCTAGVGLYLYLRLNEWAHLVYMLAIIPLGLAAVVSPFARSWSVSAWQYLIVGLLLAGLAYGWVKDDFLEV